MQYFEFCSLCFGEIRIRLNFSAIVLVMGLAGFAAFDRFCVWEWPFIAVHLEFVFFIGCSIEGEVSGCARQSGTLKTSSNTLHLLLRGTRCALYSMTSTMLSNLHHDLNYFNRL